MNIKEAKEQVKSAIAAYLKKDEFGQYRIPQEKQRPVFLIGPPGIGKTAIMEQIAQELGVPLLSYSMTHHTRQSALGLPFIETRNYGGKEYRISEYTMSEIIASVYDTIEETGCKEGILFLDEINCVSETLNPIMLQFLQYKVFGKHKVPEGWLVATAGNPPEYNNSARDFDIVTLDRLKQINVSADYDVWKEYAYQHSIHGAILTYLEIKKQDFYRVETTLDGKSFVTARGWEDLSRMMELYEEEGFPIDETLIVQYLQHPKTAKEFAIYYDLYKKYQSDYQIVDILQGNVADEIKHRAREAKFDERLSLIGLLLSTLSNQIRDNLQKVDYLKDLLKILKDAKTQFGYKNEAPEAILDKYLALQNQKLDNGIKAKNLSAEAKDILKTIISTLEADRLRIIADHLNDHDAAFAAIKRDFDERVHEMQGQTEDIKLELKFAFEFLEEVFGDSQEMLVFITELTVNYFTAKFISNNGCPEYYRHNKELLFYERQKEIISELEDFELEAEGMEAANCGGGGCGTC